MDALRDAEELVAALHDLPVGFEPDTAQQRHEGGEELGDTAAVRCGVEMEDPEAPERLGQTEDPLDHVHACGPGVIGQLLLGRGTRSSKGCSVGARNGS